MMKKKKQYKFELIDMNKYRGEWIAFIDGKIFSHGKVLRNVLERAKKTGKEPIIDKVPQQNTLIV
ncbi:MAG: DUF5678 domain-containing protein [Candidatus Omnitrophota bacterium]